MIVIITIVNKWLLGAGFFGAPPIRLHHIVLHYGTLQLYIYIYTYTYIYIYICIYTYMNIYIYA